MRTIAVLAAAAAIACVAVPNTSAHLVVKKPLAKHTKKQLMREYEHARGHVRFFQRTAFGRYAYAFRHSTCFDVKPRAHRGLCFFVRERVRAHEWLMDAVARRLWPAPTFSIAGVWAALAGCESGGDWSYNGGSGFDGGLQFEPGTWSSYRLPGYPAYAYQATPAQQIAVAERVLAEQGWNAWPACSLKLGLR